MKPKNKICINKEKIKIVYIGDTHCGSEYGIATSDILTKAGRKLSLSKEQRWLLKNYKKDLKKIGSCDILVLMGDLAEGPQPKALGRTLMDSDTDTHVSCAVKVISLAVDQLQPKYLISVPGTDYHVQGYGNLDFQTTNLLKEKYSAINFISGFEKGILNISINKLQYHITHVSSTAKNTLGSIYTKSKELVWSAGVTKGKFPNVFVSGHSHKFSVGAPRPNVPYGFTTPCLKCGDLYTAKTARLTTSVPDIGILVTEQVGGRTDINWNLTTIRHEGD